MRKVVAETLESIAGYRIVDADRPEPKAGEVLIAVEAVGVGYADALVALGRYQVKPPLPHTPGQEAGGQVAALGEGVEGLKVGARVMAQVRGGFADFAIAPAAAVQVIPDAMSAAEAAGFRINYLTALHGLRDRAQLKAGETVVVLGAAGGVGAAGIQVAKLMGARVVAAASTEEKRDFCLALGADTVLDTEPEGWRDRLKAAAGGQPTVIYDPVCGLLFEPAFRSLGWGGRHLVMGFVGGPIPALPSNLTLMKGAALVGVDVRQFLGFEPERAVEHMDNLMGWVAAGRLKAPVGRSFVLEDFADALEFALTGKGLGKTIVTI
jgi:NADPH2:quinone reductase